MRNELRDLLKVSTFWSVKHIALNYALLILVFSLAWFTVGESKMAFLCLSPLFVFGAFCVFWRLEVLSHEGQHFLLSKSRMTNDFLCELCNIVILLPTFKNRKSHQNHHRSFKCSQANLDEILTEKATNGNKIDFGERSVRDGLNEVTNSISMVRIGIFLGLGSALAYAYQQALYLVLIHAAAIVVLLLVRAAHFFFGHDFTHEFSTADRRQFPMTHDIGIATNNFYFSNKFTDIIINPYNFGAHLTHHLYPYIPARNLIKASELLEISHTFSAQRYRDLGDKILLAAGEKE